MTWNIQNYGERGVLLNGLDAKEREELRIRAESEPPEGLAEYVPGFENLLLLFDRPIKHRLIRDWLENTKPPTADKKRTVRMQRHIVPVVYDGPDLESVARMIGGTVDEVVRMHSRATYTVRMTGFAPGFPYLDGLDPRLQLSRRETPRNRIAPGSVAIGGPHAGIYPVASPGGWHLLGRTNMLLFRPERAGGLQPELREVFPIHAGDSLTFKPVGNFEDA